MKEWLLGIPAGKRSESLFWQHLTEYMQLAPGLKIEIQVSNRVDLNRSYLIDHALKQNLNLIMIDSDVLILTKWQQLKHILTEDFKDNDTGAVIGAVVGVNGQLLTQKPKDINAKTWLVDYGSLSFVALKHSLLEKLPVFGEYSPIGGETVKMRTTYAINTSEDIVLCQKIRGLNRKILVDTRIDLAHLQNVPLTMRNWNKRDALGVQE